MTQYYELEHFDDFLGIARQQSPGEHLLLVLARRELPDDHTADQAQRFAAGEGGHLAPLAILDSPARALNSFTHLARQADQFAGDWHAVFVAALSGTRENSPTPEVVFEAGEAMLDAVRGGRIGSYLVFDRQGAPLHLSAG
ncbi:hypothetical protein ACXYTJ_16815 [Gilvimarinus sp. F26214L]|uniref:hypothetical protein n=1 Tax=Gilvimarinus sp. DZF01 TaxID=3461371 RepID=UPI0040461274